MATWSNADSLSSWKKLQSLKGMVSVADELSVWTLPGLDAACGMGRNEYSL